MSTLRNEAVIYTFTNERQSLEDVIVTSEAGGDVGDRLRKSLLYKCDMLCHTTGAIKVQAYVFTCMCMTCEDLVGSLKLAAGLEA